jgi:Flp pilus assembly protein TadG
MRMNKRDPRGSVFLLTIVLVIPFMLIMAGIAIDMGALVTLRNELHRATDAAALAGAGKLGFDDTVFPTVRANAVTYGANNPTHFGAVSLDPNASNSPTGDVVLGVWDPSKAPKFSPSLDGSVVNAVLCRTTQSLPTSFLRLAGITSITMSGQSIAVANPPNTPPGCVFPIGVTTCQFFNGSAWSSAGCGTAVTFATSSGKVPGTQAGSNTGAWINLTGTGQANGPYLNPAISAAANGTCASNPVAGQSVNANNGMIQSVVDNFEGYFIQKYNASNVTKVSDGNGGFTYEGKGWEVYVPLIETECPPKSINQTYVIQTFAKFIFTQVINHGVCVVNNPADTNSHPLCPPPYGPGAKDPNLRAIFGYFDCASLTSTPTTIPTPRAALANRLRLVQ